MKSYVKGVGNQYVSLPGTPSATSAFMNFINHAALLRQALYHDSTGNLSMNFVLQSLPSPGVDHVTLTIDGVTLSADPKTLQKQTFPWPTSTPGLSLGTRIGGGNKDLTMIDNAGPWAVWHALDRAARAGNTVEWALVTSGESTTSIGGVPVTVKFSLDPQSAEILRPKFFSGLTCVSKAIQ
jgi:type VI protein secretion system component VasK